MIEAPYRKDKPYDEFLEQTMVSVRNHIQNKNDDFLALSVGDTGSGKSTLNLHALEIYMPAENLDISQVALSREEFAQSLKEVANKPKPRVLLYDEANVNRRDSMSSWNKDVIDLYMSCRGLNILHLWANPTLNLIDKAFIEDRLRAVILVKGKNQNVRYYFWFRKQDILQIYRKYGSLSIDLLNKVRGKHAWYRGWFKDYNGILKEAYLKKKNARMQMKVDKFFEKYAEDNLIKKSVVAKTLGVHEDTIHKYTSFLVEDVHYKMSVIGKYRYTSEGVEELKSLLSKKHNSSIKEMEVLSNETD